MPTDEDDDPEGDYYPPDDEGIFSVSEESDAGGVSYCWVVKKADRYYLYGNELGCIAGPKSTAVDAAAGYTYGMNYAEIKCKLSKDEFIYILESAFILTNFECITINGAESPSTTLRDLVQTYSATNVE